MAHFSSLLVIGAIDLPLFNAMYGSSVSIAKGQDILCKSGLVNLEIECCNVVEE